MLLFAGDGNLLLMHGFDAFIAETPGFLPAFLKLFRFRVHFLQRLFIRFQTCIQFFDLTFTREEIGGFSAHGSTCHGAA